MEYLYDVFISYSSHDQKIVEGICAYLEQHRIRCFVAYRDIPAGVVWAGAIVDGLDSSRMMLVVFSDSFNSSKQVDREIELASEDNKPILTFRISNDDFKGAKKYYLKNINWIDAFPDPEHSFGPLLNNVCRLLGIEPQTKPTDTTSSLKKESHKVEKKAEKPNVVSKDNRPSEEWFDPAHLDSMSDSKKVAYLRKLSEQDNAEAQFNEIIKWYRKAADQGDAAAQNNLGLIYDEGLGVKQDYAEAVKWYRKAAEQDNARAQDNLGTMYYNGHGVKQDYAEAVKWYRKAADQGYAAAQCDLGYMYYKGLGVKRDYDEAVKWYFKAAEQGDDVALNNLGLIL